MVEFEKIIHNKPKNIENSFVLAGNIGGTTTTLTLAQIFNTSFTFILSFKYESKKITNFSTIVNQVLDQIKKEYKITVKDSCFASAGIISKKRDFCQPTNISWSIDTKKLVQDTSLEKILLVNDFEAIGYATKVKEKTLILGPGTGLGACLVYENKVEATELGHTRYEPSEEYKELQEFILKKTKKKHTEMECFVSGRGIGYAYEFYKGKELEAEKVARKKNICNSAKKAFSGFFEMYADVAKKLVEKTKAKKLILVGHITNQYNEEITKEMKKQKIPFRIEENEDLGLMGAYQKILIS